MLSSSVRGHVGTLAQRPGRLRVAGGRSYQRTHVPAHAIAANPASGVLWCDQAGMALIMTLMVLLLLSALGLALVMTTQTETLISTNYRRGQEAVYAADAILDRATQDLVTVAQWNSVLAGTVKSGFVDGPAGPRTLPDGTVLNLNTYTPTLPIGVTGAQLYAYGPLLNLDPTAIFVTNQYVALWVADDACDETPQPCNAASDANGVVLLHAEAWGENGTHKILESLISRTSNTELERGYTGQRGQDEQNRRARKAAVQTPGKALTEMGLSLSTGGLVVK